MSTNTTREASDWVVPGPPGAIVEKEGPRNGAASRRFVPGEGNVPGGDADYGTGVVAQVLGPAGVPRRGARPAHEIIVAMTRRVTRIMV